MAKLNKIKLPPASEFNKILAGAGRPPFLLETDGELYRVDRADGTEDIWAGYDPEEVRKALAATVGSWSDLDADSMIAELRRAREEGSRPATRP